MTDHTVVYAILGPGRPCHVAGGVGRIVPTIGHTVRLRGCPEEHAHLVKAVHHDDVAHTVLVEVDDPHDCRAERAATGGLRR